MVSKEKKEDSVTDHHCQKYIVTTTLKKCLRSFKRIGLKIPEEDFIEKIEAELIDLIKSNLDGDNVGVTVLNFGDMCDDLVAHAHSAKQKHPESVIVSTSPLIAYEADGDCAYLNRLVNFEGEIIGIGPRPGHCSLSRQLQSVRQKPIIIIEDGAFTGKTLQFILNNLPEKNIITIVLGVLFPEAEALLKKIYSGDLFYQIGGSRESLLDWVPTHDFLPFVPNCGRVVGAKMGQSHFPLYLYDRASMSMPYIFLYGKPKEWASLRGSKKDLVAFSVSCIRLSRRIYREIESVNNKELLIRDVIHSSPATSIAVASDQNDFSDDSERIIDILTEDLKFLS